MVFHRVGQSSQAVGHLHVLCGGDWPYILAPLPVSWTVPGNVSLPLASIACDGSSELGISKALASSMKRFHTLILLTTITEDMESKVLTGKGYSPFPEQKKDFLHLLPLP